jgi:hypothetical protein
MNDDLIINPDVKTEDKPDFQKDLAYWRKLLSYMGANVPIQVLCLPKSLEKSLLNASILRVYDLIGRDLTEIKGIGKIRAELLASRLDEFFTVCI